MKNIINPLAMTLILTSLSGCASDPTRSDLPLIQIPNNGLPDKETAGTYDDAGFQDISFTAQKKYRALTNQWEIAKQTDNYVNHGQADTIIRPDGTVLYPYGLAEARLIVKKMMYSKIILQEGEKIINAAAGDTIRWNILPGYIGDAKFYTPVILVKPFTGGLQSSLSIITDKRDYDIALQSVDSGDYIPRIGFYYPQDKADAINGGLPAEKEDHRLQPKIDIEHIQYNYRMSGDRRLAWYPVKVFEDGHKVFIKMPDAVDHAQLPVFMALDSRRQPEVVNYRYSRPYYVIDTIFNQGILILGTDRYKQTIQLTKVS